MIYADQDDPEADTVDVFLWHHRLRAGLDAAGRVGGGGLARRPRRRPQRRCDAGSSPLDENDGDDDADVRRRRSR